LGIGERVHFHGYQPDPAQLLSAAQVFVLSSRAEAFPRSILEAMRAGLPVVASRVGGIEEAISHQEHGLLVAPGDPAPLASALGGLIDDANLREKLGLQARRRYEAEFRFERMAAELLSVYREFC
jgi:glycosyltransferase involved in cell wall biosynthesis